MRDINDQLDELDDYARRLAGLESDNQVLRMQDWQRKAEVERALSELAASRRVLEHVRIECGELLEKNRALRAELDNLAAQAKRLAAELAGATRPEEASR